MEKKADHWWWSGAYTQRVKEEKVETGNSLGQMGVELKQNPTHQDDGSSSRSPNPNGEYTVELPIEMAAGKGMVDGDPQTLPEQADQNTYILGCIGKFKVVVASLPRDESLVLLNIPWTQLSTNHRFLLAYLNMNALKSQPTKRRIKDALHKLAKGEKELDKAYQQTIERIQS